MASTSFGANKKTTIIIAVMLAISTSIFVAPQPVRAQYTDFANLVPNLISGLANPTSAGGATGGAAAGGVGAAAGGVGAAAGTSNAASTLTLWLKAYVLDPVAWGVAQGILQTMTGKIIALIGNGNKGAPMFVTNLQGHLQGVGDSQTSAFLVQFAANSKSPFAASIASSLRTNYLRGTSLAGFWAANQCTLSKSSSDVNKFLAGDYSQGGAKAWFALTTQEQNNPYMLYQNSQAQLGSVVGGAQAARTAQVNQGQGFLSTCTTDSGNSSAAGANPGDKCTNKNGSPGTVQTPASVISASLNKALGSTIDRTVNINQISQIISSIVSSLVSDTLNKGLLAMTTGPVGTRAIDTYTQAPVTAPINVSGQIDNKMNTDVLPYQSAWEKISESANTASSSINNLIKICNDSIALAQVYLASTTPDGKLLITSTNKYSKQYTELHNLADIPNGTASQQINLALGALQRFVVNYAINPYNDALANIAAVNAMAEKIQDEATSTTASSLQALTSDLSTFMKMSPTNKESSDANIIYAQDNYGALSSAAAANGTPITDLSLVASPLGSLNIVTPPLDKSIVDMMGLLSTNANKLGYTPYSETTAPISMCTMPNDLP